MTMNELDGRRKIFQFIGFNSMKERHTQRIQLMITAYIHKFEKRR